MYEIDMLKRQGVPRKSTPVLTILTTMAVAIPLFVCVLLSIEYMSNQIQIKFNSSILAKIQEKVKSVPYNERLDNRLKQELGVDIATTDEIIAGVDRNVQWSSILTEIVSYLPENLAIADFDVRRSVDRFKIPNPEVKNGKIDVETITRTLKMTIFNLKTAQSNDDAQEYINKLNESELLKGCMESAKIAMIKVDDFDGKTMPCYLIECVFKSGYKGGEE